MRAKTCLVALLVMTTIARGEEMPWSVSGSVTTVIGSNLQGLGINPGDPVAVQFSYDTFATPADLGAPLPGLIQKTGYWGMVSLGVTVDIGGQIWSGSLAEAPEDVYPLRLEDFNEVAGTEKFTVRLSSTQGGSFTSFPDGGATGTLREIQLDFFDTQSPPLFLDYQFGSLTPLPTGETDSCEITSARGSIRAGMETIDFSIDPVSIVIGPYPSAGTLVPVSIATSGAGSELSWNTVDGKSYEVHRSCHLQSWSVVGTRQGTGGAVVFPLPSFTADLASQFYRVVELD